LPILDYAHRSVRFRGKYDVWYAAASACCIACYLRRRSGQQKKAIQDLQKFLKPPCHAIVFQTGIWTAAFVRKHLAEERERFARWFDSPKTGTAIEARAWWIATLVFFRELALNGFPRKGKISVGRLDLWIEKALEELAVKLHDED
jgi:hypothetical protein